MSVTQVTARAIFKCERYGIGVLIELDFIERNPFIPITTVLGNFYNRVDVRHRYLFNGFL